MGCAEIYDGAEGSWVILTVLWTPPDRRRQHLKQKSNSDSIRIWRWFSIGNSLHGGNGNRNRIGTAITNLSFRLDHSRERSPGTVSNSVRKICRSCHHWYLRWERDCSRSRSSLDQCSTKKSMNSTLSSSSISFTLDWAPVRKLENENLTWLLIISFSLVLLIMCGVFFGSFELVWRCAVGQFANTRARFLHPEASTKWNRARHTYIGQVYISSMNFFLYFLPLSFFPRCLLSSQRLVTARFWLWDAETHEIVLIRTQLSAHNKDRAVRFACSQK